MTQFKTDIVDYEIEHLNSHERRCLVESINDYNTYVANILKTIMPLKQYTEMTNCFPSEKLIKKGA